MAKGKIKSNSIATSEELVEYLSQKALNHVCYKFYSNREKIHNIISTHSVYLSRGQNWNDVIDKENFNPKDSEHINFGLCLSFSKSENVAMWMLYSGNEGCMVDYTKEVILDILNTTQVSFGNFVNGSFVSKLVLERADFQIRVIDMLYYGESKNKGKYYVKRSDEVNDDFDSTLIDNVTFCKKTTPWSYENECRLIVSVKRDLIKDAEITDAAIAFSKEYRAELLKRLYDSPNAINPAFNESRMRGKINWKLYRDCVNCKNDHEA